MQRAIIILLIIIFGLSTVSVYIGAAGTNPGDPSRGSESTRSQQSQQNPDRPAYLQSDKINVRDTVDATDQSEATVTVDDHYFTPTILHVSQGTTVTWRNQGEGRHGITSDRNSPRSGLDSGSLESGETYQHTFDELGVYNYYSPSHPVKMKAVVKVVE